MKIELGLKAIYETAVFARIYNRIIHKSVDYVSTCEELSESSSEV